MFTPAQASCFLPHQQQQQQKKDVMEFFCSG